MDYLKRELYKVIKEHKEIFDFVLEFNLYGCWFWDVGKPENLWMDHKMKKTLGFEETCPQNLPNREWEKVFSTVQLQNLLDHFSAAPNSKAENHKITIGYYNQNGFLVQMQCKSWAILNGNSEIEFIFGGNLDMMNQEIPKERKLPQYAKFEEIINSSNIGTWEWNVQTGELIINDRWADIIGYTIEELMPVNLETWNRLAHPEDLEKSKLQLMQHFNGDADFYSCELRMWHKNGHWIWIQDNGKVISRSVDGEPLWMFGSHLDITKRKNYENQLAHYKTLLDRTNEVARIGTWELDLEENKLNWSKITKEIHEVNNNYEPELIKAIRFYRKGESQRVIKKAMNEAISSGKSFDVELQILTAKKNIKWVRAVGLSDFDSGKCIRIYGVFQDITPSKSQLSITQDQNQRLLNFAHIVSHNLKSHAGNFSMLADLLMDEFPDALDNDVFRLMKAATKNLVDTVSHLNEVVMMNSFTAENLQQINLKMAVVTTLGGLHGLANDLDASIHVDIDPQLEILAIPAYLDSILLNLLDNAFKYRSTERNFLLEVTAQKIPDFTVLYVKDNGLGIDLKKYGSKIFGMYKTFHGNKDAKGIGLFITKNQIEALGGKIEVKSKKNQGSTFIVYFKS